MNSQQENRTVTTAPEASNNGNDAKPVKTQTTPRAREQKPGSSKNRSHAITNGTLLAFLLQPQLVESTNETNSSTTVPNEFVTVTKHSFDKASAAASKTTAPAIRPAASSSPTATTAVHNTAGGSHEAKTLEQKTIPSADFLVRKVRQLDKKVLHDEELSLNVVFPDENPEIIAHSFDLVPPKDFPQPNFAEIPKLDYTESAETPSTAPTTTCCTRTVYGIVKAPFHRPGHYIRYVAPNPDTRQGLLETIDYDMDSDDEEFLGTSGVEITNAQFEGIIDRFEKESYLATSSKPQDVITTQLEMSENDDVCGICGDGASDDANQIVYCDGKGCNVAVHQACYGLPSIPDGDWLCYGCHEKCHTPEDEVVCCLCHVKGGALKRTTDGRYCHVICGIWIPEAVMVYQRGRGISKWLDAIDVSKVPAERIAKCDICGTEGACISCGVASCKTAYHPFCAKNNPKYSVKTNFQFLFHDIDTRCPTYLTLCSSHKAKPSVSWKQVCERTPDRLIKTPCGETFKYGYQVTQHIAACTICSDAINGITEDDEKMIRRANLRRNANNAPQEPRSELQQEQEQLKTQPDFHTKADADIQQALSSSSNQGGQTYNEIAPTEENQCSTLHQRQSGLSTSATANHRHLVESNIKIAHQEGLLSPSSKHDEQQMETQSIEQTEQKPTITESQQKGILEHPDEKVVQNKAKKPSARTNPKSFLKINGTLTGKRRFIEYGSTSLTTPSKSMKRSSLATLPPLTPSPHELPSKSVMPPTSSSSPQPPQQSPPSASPLPPTSVQLSSPAPSFTPVSASANKLALNDPTAPHSQEQGQLDMEFFGISPSSLSLWFPWISRSDVEKVLEYWIQKRKRKNNAYLLRRFDPYILCVNRPRYAMTNSVCNQRMLQRMKNIRTRLIKTRELVRCTAQRERLKLRTIDTLHKAACLFTMTPLSKGLRRIVKAIKHLDDYHTFFNKPPMDKYPDFPKTHPEATCLLEIEHNVYHNGYRSWDDFVAALRRCFEPFATYRAAPEFAKTLSQLFLTHVVEPISKLVDNSADATSSTHLPPTNISAPSTQPISSSSTQSTTQQTMQAPSIMPSAQSVIRSTSRSSSTQSQTSVTTSTPKAPQTMPATTASSSSAMTTPMSQPALDIKSECINKNDTSALLVDTILAALPRKFVSNKLCPSATDFKRVAKPKVLSENELQTLFRVDWRHVDKLAEDYGLDIYNDGKAFLDVIRQNTMSESHEPEGESEDTHTNFSKQFDESPLARERRRREEHDFKQVKKSAKHAPTSRTPRKPYDMKESFSHAYDLTALLSRAPEKQTKESLAHSTRQATNKLRLTIVPGSNPPVSYLQVVLELVIERLRAVDDMNIFEDPVTDDIAPGYSTRIKHPMCISVMAEKVKRGAYRSMSEFKEDFRTMCDNALLWNPTESIFYTETLRIRRNGRIVMNTLSKEWKESQLESRTPEFKKALPPIIFRKGDEDNVEPLQQLEEDKPGEVPLESSPDTKISSGSRKITVPSLSGKIMLASDTDLHIQNHGETSQMIHSSQGKVPPTGQDETHSSRTTTTSKSTTDANEQLHTDQVVDTKSTVVESEDKEIACSPTPPLPSPEVSPATQASIFKRKMRLKNTAKNDVTMPMMEQEETAEVPQGKQKIEATIANNLVEKEQKSQSASSLKISRSSPLPEKQVKAMHPETTIFEQNDKVRDKTIPSSSESPIPPPVIKIPLKNS